MGRFAGSRAATILFALVSGATVLGTWLTLFDRRVVDSFLWAWMITAALTFLAIAVHELGHALAALRYRQRIRAFAVFPFELRFRPLRLSLSAADARRDTGGYVRYGGGDPSRYVIGLIAAAGPLASLALALLALCAGLVLPLFAADGGAGIDVAQAGHGSSFLPSDGDVAHWVERWAATEGQRRAAATGAGVSFALALLSGGIGIANLIPVEGSDGEKMLECLLRPFGSSRPI
jgi:hypothetical protein